MDAQACEEVITTQAAKSLGTSLRGFAPTIRELAGVSNELKQTLEQEIGLDEIRREWRDGSLPPLLQQRSNSFQEQETSSSNRLEPDAASSGQPTKAELKEVTDEMAQQVDPDIARRRAESAQMAWGDTANSSAPSNSSQEVNKAPKTDAPAAPKVSDSKMEGMSIAELEAELARRRSKQSSHSSSQ